MVQCFSVTWRTLLFICIFQNHIFPHWHIYPVSMWLHSVTVYRLGIELNSWNQLPSLRVLGIIWIKLCSEWEYCCHVLCSSHEWKHWFAPVNTGHKSEFWICFLFFQPMLWHQRLTWSVIVVSIKKRMSHRDELVRTPYEWQVELYLVKRRLVLWSAAAPALQKNENLAKSIKP